jgi:hypothetical protein
MSDELSFIRDQNLTPKIPEDCPQILREIMEMCWKRDPNERPVSTIIHSQVYISFSFII